MGPKMTPLYSAVDGRVRSIIIPEASYGYAITIEDADGYTYRYLHINNDTPGTDDGLGGLERAYAPGIERGTTVVKGQLIGWMGDSGNAESVGSHLHFEIRRPDHSAINPYPSLMAAKNIGGYSLSIAKAASPTININQSLTVGLVPAFCLSDTLIKTTSTSAVYYCGADGKRHAFTNDKSYFTWYSGFDDVITISPDLLAMIPLGSNVTYRPGIKLLKLQTDPKIYALEQNGLLRWIPSPDLASQLYGATWGAFVDDISDAFFGDYQIGSNVLSIQS